MRYVYVTMKMFFITLWMLGIAAMVALAMVPNLIAMNGGADKMLHLLAFCMMTIWPAMTFIQIRMVIIALLGIFAVGVGMEVLQEFVPTRQASVMDVVYNTIGIVFGGLIGSLLRDTYQLLIPRAYAHLQTRDNRREFL